MYLESQIGQLVIRLSIFCQPFDDCLFDIIFKETQEYIKLFINICQVFILLYILSSTPNISKLNNKDDPP